ncbi:MAG: immunoglobulin domain-containing protein [Verrucomicrobiota bacterium]
MSFTLHSQTLNLPPRPANALNGSDFASTITPMAAPGVGPERENWIYAQIASGNVPNFMRTLVAVTTNAVINGTNHTITYFVTPDYMAVGTDTNYFLTPMTPLLAQRLADLVGCSLPTRKMVNDIWKKAAVKLAPAPIAPSPEMITVPVFVQHNSMVRTQRLQQIAAHPLGALVGGDKKDVIISNETYNRPPPPRVVIYGWHNLDGSFIQPLSAVHEETYADYSHGIRLVQMNVTVDGISKTLTNVLTDPNLAALVSDEGVIAVPRYTVSAVAPFITTQPFSRTVNVGEDVNFSVLTAGTPTLNYQWKFNGTNVTDATKASFAVTNVQTTNLGSYTVFVNNGAGSASSIPALLRLKTTNFPVLFKDDFETNSSANWNLFWGAGNGMADYTVNWSFDYGTNTYAFNGKTYAIPPAPNSTNGTTRGVKFTVNDNDTNGWIAGVNIYPKNKSFSGNYVLKCDMWLNYPGAAGGAGSTGSTEHGIFGIDHLGTQVNWASTNASASDGIWFGVDGEGGTTTDYRTYVGNPAGNPLPTNGLATSDNASGIYPLLFPTNRFETIGAPGKNWVVVEVIQTNNNLIWKLDGTAVAQRTNSSSFMNGNIMLGLMDTFSSIASPAKDSFVIFDNVRVENLSELRFGAVSKLADGKFQTSLVGVAGENYWIEASTNLANWETLSLLPGSNNPSVFVDDTAATQLFRYYRARREAVP